MGAQLLVCSVLVVVAVNAQEFQRFQFPPLKEFLKQEANDRVPTSKMPFVMRPAASSGTRVLSSHRNGAGATHQDASRGMVGSPKGGHVPGTAARGEYTSVFGAPMQPIPQPDYSAEYPIPQAPPQRPHVYTVETQPKPSRQIPSEFPPMQSGNWVLRPSGHQMTAMPGTIAPPPTTTTAEPVDNSYAINYCDRHEFPDETLSQYGLERVEYFLFNASCSQIFFQCSIGQTFLLKCPSPDQAFDRTTVNCNFRNSVRECPEYDHVMHCTIAESCNENQFACCAHPQACIDIARRCDGRPDCSDGEDENNCPSCKTDEFACVKSGRCIPAAERCDGMIDDCGDGSNLDEVGCSKNSTCLGKFVCDSTLSKSVMGTHNCIEYIKHCDGMKDCPSGEDEINCKMAQAKYLLCENQKQSVTKQQWCDGNEDCSDASDEKYCY